MKASLVTSAALHGLVIFWALFSLSAPRTLDVADVEALPVDIVPVESITQVQKGDKKAPVAEVSAPKPTIRPDPVENAQEIGNNSVDLKASQTKKESQKQVEAAAPPKASEKPSPKIDDTASKPPEPQPEPEPKPEPPTKVASLPKPADAAEPEPAPKEAPPEPAAQPLEPTADTPEPAPSEEQKFASLPDAGPTPSTRPQPPAPKAAEKPEPKKPEPPKKAEKKPDEVAKKIEEASSAKKNDFDADKIAALLNREDSSGGGAKRSTEKAALGGSRTTTGHKLTQSEMDALRAQIQKNWNIIPGMADGEDVRIQVTMRLDPSGAIVGNPQVSASGGSDQARRTLASSARRAVLMSSPFQGLPPEKYAAWSEVVVNFDPSQLQMY